jgi:hypothetical protein
MNRRVIVDSSTVYDTALKTSHCPDQAVWTYPGCVLIGGKCNEVWRKGIPVQSDTNEPARSVHTLVPSARRPNSLRVLCPAEMRAGTVMVFTLYLERVCAASTISFTTSSGLEA